MPLRVVDGKKIYNEGWDSLTRDVFFWLLTVGADSLGMQPEMPGTVAEALSSEESRVSRQAVEKRLALLCSGDNSPLFCWKGNGKRFLIFRSWQNFQNIRYGVTPTCPLPPAEVFLRLSGKTQNLLRANYGVTLEERRGTLVFVAVSVSENRDLEGKPSSSLPANRRGTQKKTQEKKALPAIDEELWEMVWEVLGSIPGWPAEEEKSRATTAQAYGLLPQSDLVRESTRMKLWHLKNPHKKPGLRRWVSWLQIGEEKRVTEDLRRQEGLAPSGMAGSDPRPAWPDPAGLNQRQALELLQAARKDGRLIPADLQREYCGVAGIKHSWEIEKKLAQVAGK
jgi:hypothetical protein